VIYRFRREVVEKKKGFLLGILNPEDGTYSLSLKVCKKLPLLVA